MIFVTKHCHYNLLQTRLALPHQESLKLASFFFWFAVLLMLFTYGLVLPPWVLDLVFVPFFFCLLFIVAILIFFTTPFCCIWRTMGMQNKCIKALSRDIVVSPFCTHISSTCPFHWSPQTWCKLTTLVLHLKNQNMQNKWSKELSDIVLSPFCTPKNSTEIRKLTKSTLLQNSLSTSFFFSVIST